MKLNLGCGRDLKDGWVNVDTYGDGVVKHDLNEKPWPWAADSVEEVLLHNVLEHLPDTIGVMKELYRVCKKDALVHIAVPHPRHDDFISDPTHVSNIVPGTLHSFSKKANQATIRDANNPLALIHDVDFEMVKEAMVVEPRWMKRMEDGLITEEQLRDAILTFNNVVKQIEMTVRVVK
jgi:hypothetical protein